MIRDKRGHVVIELAFAFPLIAMIAFAFVMYMHGIALQVGMGVATREGAREYATKHYDEDAIQRAEDTLKTYGVDDYTIELIRDGRYQGIAVSKNYQVFIPMLGSKTYHLRRAHVFYPEPLGE